MASGDVQGYLKGAYDSQVQITGGAIITLEEYIKRVNDDSESLTITGLLGGAYEAMVELSDGSITPLTEYVRSPGALTISKLVGGGYESTVNLETNGIVTTAEKVILDKGPAPSVLELSLEEGDLPTIVNLEEE